MTAVLLRAENTLFIYYYFLLLLCRIMFKLPKYPGTSVLSMGCAEYWWFVKSLRGQTGVDQVKLQTSAWKCSCSSQPKIPAASGLGVDTLLHKQCYPFGSLGLYQACQSSENKEKWSAGYKMNVLLEMTLRTARKGRITGHTPLQSFPFSAFSCKRKRYHYLPVAIMFAFPCGFQGVAPMHFYLS